MDDASEAGTQCERIDQSRLGGVDDPNALVGWQGVR
jgi:hypothetical protein